MSTRKYLKDRRRYFRLVLFEDPNNRCKEVLKEIDFILKKLKEYDIERTKAE